MKYYTDNNYVEAHVSENVYYCTGRDGYGLFRVDSERNSRSQILGTAQFSVVGVKSKKAKLRRFLSKYRDAN